MAYFAHHRRSKPTGELLAAMLQLPHGDNPAEDLEGLETASDDLGTLIRWGNRAQEWLDDAYTVVNPCEALRNASHKVRANELMTEAGVEVPAWDIDPYNLIGEYGYPILGRKFHHARGTDIKLVLQERDLRKRRDYYSVYIPTNREYRIHVVGDEVIRVQGKYLDRPELKQSHIRNYATGYRFRAPRMRLRPDRLTMAVSAVKSLGLDFGAVDLILADDGSCYVLEVNTAPSCSPLTLGAYAVAFQKNYLPEVEIDMSVVDMIDNSIEEMDSDDEGEEDGY
jgi:hypothetical protein